MATYSDIAHMWANKNFGKKGELRSGNCSCDPISFYSYRTVIGQWLDKDKDVMVIIGENLSRSTGKHVSALRNAVPAHTHLFTITCPSSYWEWRNAHLIDRYQPFDSHIRMYMVNTWINELYAQYAKIPESRALTDSKISRQFLLWQINELNALYRNDASLKKWLKKKFLAGDQKEWMRKRRMVKALLEDLPNDKVVDAMYGAGTWQAYQERIKPQCKAEHSRLFAKKVNKYLGISTMEPQYSYQEIKRMSPAEMMAIKFRNQERHSEQYKKALDHKMRARWRAMNYIGIEYSREYNQDRALSVTNRFTGEKIYWFDRAWYWYNMEDKVEVMFNAATFKDFCNASDKRHWIERFYQLCQVKRSRIFAKELAWDINSGIRHVDSLSSTEIAIYDAYCEREQQRKRAYELRRAREAEERAVRAAESEAIERAKREEQLQKLAEYKERGMEGLRDIWYEHVGPIPSECRYLADYYHGGNVLLRFSKDKKCVETSKHITLTRTVCTKMWNKIKQWHDNPERFAPTTVQTSCGNFTISSFKNGILTAGCHSIAYVEMERMYHLITQQHGAI